MLFDEHYYLMNSQNKDRPALWFYERIWLRCIGKGPVLDFGCGVGYFGNRLSKYTQVYGLEINEYARKQLKLNAPKIRIKNNLNELKSKSVSSIVSLHVLEHISDNELLFIGNEFNRIIRPGGKLLVVMPNLSGHAQALKGNNWKGFFDKTHINLKTEKKWLDFFETKWNCKVLKSFSDGFYDFPYGNSFSEKIIGDSIRFLLTGIQFILTRPVLKPDYGENIIFLLEANK